MPGNSVRIQSAMRSWSSMSKARKRCTKLAKTRGVAIVFHAPQSLREIGLPAPECDVQRTRRRARINPLDEPSRTFRVVPFADVCRVRAAGCRT